MKPIIKKFLIVTFSFFAAVYFSALCLLPLLLNSKVFASTCAHIFNQKTGYKTTINGVNFSVSKSLHLKFKIETITLYSSSKKILNLSHLAGDISPFNIKNGLITVDDFYFKKTPKTPPKNKEKKFSLNYSKAPNLKIKNATIDFCAKPLQAKAVFKDIVIVNKDGGKAVSFDLEIASPYFAENLKVSKESKIYISKDGVFTDEFKIFFNNTNFMAFSGKIIDKNSIGNFTLKTSQFPAEDAKNIFLFFIKQKSQKKNFIENFKNFKGFLSVDLRIINGDFFGTVKFSNLKATLVQLSIPISFEKLIFYFDKKDVFMKEVGLFGGEIANVDFLLTGIASPSLQITGSVNSALSNAFAEKYIDDLFIKNKVAVNVDYAVKNGVTDVIYTALLGKNADLCYHNAGLGLIDKERRLEAFTRKNGDVITLVNYAYSVKFDKIYENIIFGSGKFEKRAGKYALVKLSGKTIKNAPVSLLGFLENRLFGGFFTGNLEFNFDKKCLIGSIILSNSRFRGFKIKDGAIFGDKNFIYILANGTLFGEAFNCEIDLKNKLESHLYVNRADVYLKKYSIQGSSLNIKPHRRLHKRVAAYYPNVTIKDMTLRLDEFQKGKIILKHIALFGSVENNIFKFSMPAVLFAEGKLSATGKFDAKRHHLIADFTADNINSNLAAYQVFNLKNQIKGKAGAKMHLEIAKSFKNITGSASFNIKEGALLQIGNIEFVIKSKKGKNPFKFSLSDMVRVNKSAEINPVSNIAGSFKINNCNLDDINLYLQNSIISLFMEGKYNIKTEDAALNLWGKYDAEIERKTSIFHIPLSFITKIAFKAVPFKSFYYAKFKKVPNINALEKDIKHFNIVVNGKLNYPRGLNIQLNSVKAH